LQIIAEYDLSGVIIWMRPELGRLLGVDHVMAAGEPLRSFLPLHSKARFEYNFSNVMKGGNISEFIRLIIPIRVYPFVFVTYHLPAFDENGSLTSIKIVTDLSV